MAQGSWYSEHGHGSPPGGLARSRWTSCSSRGGSLGWVALAAYAAATAVVCRGITPQAQQRVMLCGVAG